MNVYPLPSPIYRQRLLALLFMAAAALLAACTTPPETPVPLATPKVPSLIEVNGATTRWQNGNNLDYFVAVEETTPKGTSMYRIVISEGEIRAAQRMDRVDGVWQPPTAIDFEIAQNYTIDALLERVRRDASGEGPAPLNMFVVFDSISGFPTLVEAKAMPSYTEDGKLALNREYSYTLSVSINVLIEESFGLNKTPLLTLYLSGGEEAWCSTLRIFEDGNSIYSDNCRQTLLQLRPPQASFERLQELAAGLAPLEKETTADNEYRQLILNGTGDTTADDAVVSELWDLAFSMNELLSHPIGAGVTLLRTQGDQVVGVDMRTNLEQPATFDFTTPLHGGITDLNGRLLIFGDGSGLKWLDTVDGDSGTYAANPAGMWFVPVEVSSGGRIVLQRFNENGSTLEWGWLSQEDRTWHPIDIPGDCVSGISTNPLDARLAVAVSGGAACESEAGLRVIDLESGEQSQLTSISAQDAAWSPDGMWIAVILEKADGSGSSLSVIRPAGDSLTEVIGNTTGTVTGVVWGVSREILYFGLTGADTLEDQLVEYDLLSGEINRSLPGSNLLPIGFDPAGDFLAFREGQELRVWLLSFGQVIPVTNGGGANSLFIGWIDSNAGE